MTLSIDEKEMVGVVGPNGAGKSTLLRAISAMVPADGEILFKGERIDHHPPHEIVRRGIVHCPERRQLFVDFTVVENLEMGAFLRKDRGKIKEDLEYVYRLFPVLEETEDSVIRDPQRRGAADAGHRPGPDERPQAAHAG